MGESLFANAYDSEATPDQRIAAQDRWTYQWLAGDSRDADDSAYEAIVGQTGRSLAITEELASQLAGKYLRVKVTGDGQELFGPSGAFDRPSSTTYDTPGPVVAPGQIVVSHVILAYNGAGFGNESESVPNANVGDVIEAAAYDKDESPPTASTATTASISRGRYPIPPRARSGRWQPAMPTRSGQAMRAST